MSADTTTRDIIRAAARALPDEGRAFEGPAVDALLRRAAGARLALVGEASHGTHEFYATRIELTKRLVAEHGFMGVALEADWPDTERAHCYVTGRSDARSAEEALGGFKRFPQWMWRNGDVVEFVEWLRDFNRDRPARERVGLYGMDLYSMYGSIDAILRHLDRVDPAAAHRARTRYACFEHFGTDPQAYGYVASLDLSRSCEDDVVRQLVELQRRARELSADVPLDAADQVFSAEQNARLVQNAEEYYRSMFQRRVSSWNLRDRHMMDTVDAVLDHLARRRGVPGRLVLWAHNSHLGDARHTRMGDEGELNVGQLARERHGAERCCLIGFTTYGGTVTAADDWDEPALRKAVRPGLPGSFELLFHQVGLPRFLLDLRDPRLATALAEPRLERAIGVVYRPQTERVSHYFEAVLPRQFDVVIHIDETSAVRPLERSSRWVGPEGARAHEAPETFPTGI